MKSAWLLLAVLFWSTFCAASEWVFSSPLQVTANSDQRVFHHLESAGRRNIAVSGDTVAITWEDDRDGTPRVYMAVKKLSAPDFSADMKVSGNGEAYEPSVIGLTGEQFLVAWEEDEQVMARITGPQGSGPAIRLSNTAGGQPSLSRYGDEVIIAWSEREGRFGHIRIAQLGIENSRQLNITSSCADDVKAVEDEQLYPAVADVAGEVVVAWEDRRFGHTVIMAAQGKPCNFSAAQRISEKIEQRSVTYGKGHGVSRVALAAYGTNALLAVWADKRDFREGYDIYAASYQAGKGFSANMRVQDDFGGVARQWHPTVTGSNDGRLLVAWTDEREGNSDIMMSAYSDEEWDEDMPLSGASGPAEQAHPSIILDKDGRLHIAWVERDSRDAPTRLKYMVGSTPLE